MSEQRSGYSRPSQPAQRPQQRTQQAQPQRSQMPPTAGAGNQAPAVVQPTRKQKLFEKFGEKFGIDQELLIETLKATAFKTKAGDPPVTNEQLVALLIVADQYGLNPFTKEIYAYPDKQNGIVPVVSVDGWIRIINEHPQYNGSEIHQSEALVVSDKNEHRPCFEWMTVTIHRKDRDHPTVVTEYFDEVYRKPFVGKRGDGSTYEISGPWQTHPKRLTRHKTLIQGGRVAFGFAGIYDDDEAERILEAQAERVVHTIPVTSRTTAATEALKARQGIVATPAKPAQPAAATQENVPRPTPETNSELPWDKPLKTMAEWISAFNAAKSLEEVQSLWNDCVDQHDAARADIPVDIDAVMQLKRESFEQ